MHYKRELFFGVHNIKLKKVCTLVKRGFKGLKGVLGKNGAESTVGNVEGSIIGLDVRCLRGQTANNSNYQSKNNPLHRYY